MAKYKDKNNFLAELRNAGLNLKSTTPIICQREDGSFYLDCFGMFAEDKLDEIKKIQNIKFDGAHSKKSVAKDEKTKLCLNLLGLTVPENEKENDIVGQTIYKLVSNEQALDTPKTMEEVVRLKRKLWSQDKTAYQQMIKEMFPNLEEIINDNSFKNYLEQFEINLDDNNMVSVACKADSVKEEDAKKFKLLLSSMRTQMRASAGAWQEKICGHFNNIEFAVVCREMNDAINEVVAQFATNTFNATKKVGADKEDELKNTIANAHKDNITKNQETIASAVKAESERRAEENARAIDNMKLENIKGVLENNFETLEDLAKEHNEDIKNWNDAKDTLKAFLESEKAQDFYQDKGKLFNGQELANGLYAYLTELNESKPKDDRLKDAELGELFARCYSLMTKEYSPENLLNHKPVKNNPEISKILEAAKNAKSGPAGPSL